MSEKTINSNVAQKTITKIPKEHMQEDERQGLNGYRKTDLDLEIERELREMMDNGENTKDTKGNRFKDFTFISMIVIAIMAIVRFIHRMI